ncbi:MAG: WxcM-like domain-containing protein [Lachnospiraceae bacterium]|nr:WxcM-like domain-containing protein [Lachnospiraceae bacterium]
MPQEKQRKNIKEQYRILEFGEFGDERGNLVVAEGDGMDIPFSIKRVFYMYGSDPTVERGHHANRESEFVLINVSGTSKVKVDNGYETDVIVLDKPRMGLYIPTMLWKDMYDFSADSVLLVLTNTHFNEEEYIRDYDEYLKLVR